MWNPFKKTNPSASDAVTTPQTQKSDANNKPDVDDKSNIKDKFLGAGANMMARVAMKKMAKMNPKEQQKMMQDAMKPENKGKLLQVMEMMKKSGQISEAQYDEAKKKLGL